MAGFFNRLKEGLTKTRSNLVDRLGGLLKGRALDEEFFEELEELLLQADVGVGATSRLVDNLRLRARQERLKVASEVEEALKEEMAAILGGRESPLALEGETPRVILVVGVNGVGKTTTIGKLAHYLKGEGYAVTLVAADTFRAAAIEQLQVWGQRAGVGVVHQGPGADPAAVVFDGIQAARSRGGQVVLIDTAGRLHTKKNLMQELEKVRRVVAREVPGAPHEVLLVLDATTGQNAVSQARLFDEAVGVTGIALTKLDGTAKGGVVVAISHELGLPVKLVGVGEGLADLRPFAPSEFVEALFAREED